MSEQEIAAFQERKKAFNADKEQSLSSDAGLKGYIDIWLHHNLLMWNRLRDMLLIQITFFGAGYTLRLLKHYEFVFVPFLCAGFGTLFLMFFMNIDRATRNQAETNLKALNFKIRIERTKPKAGSQSAERYVIPSWPRVGLPSETGLDGSRDRAAVLKEGPLRKGRSFLA
jgi:hypothetical protein